MLLMRIIGRTLASQQHKNFSLTSSTYKINTNNNNHRSNSVNQNIVIVNNNPKSALISNQITIKDSCLNRLKQILDNPNEQYLRIHVEAGGCSGFLYLFEIEPSEKINPSEDLIFQRDQYRIVVEKQELPYIQGSEIEYNESLIKSSFKIINPIADAKCSCGSSFSIDFAKQT